jgi:hypothetical protein
MQMLYSMYELTPNVNIQKRSIEIKYNQFWQPIGIGDTEKDRVLEDYHT